MSANFCGVNTSTITDCSYQHDATCEPEGAVLAHHLHVADKISVEGDDMLTFSFLRQRASIGLIGHHEDFLHQNCTQWEGLKNK